MSIIRAAVVQAGSHLFDVPRTLDDLAERTATAARAGAELVVFPEAYLGGYPKGLDFGARVGLRRPEGRLAFQRYHDGAITVPGPAVDRLSEIAAAHGTVLVVGAIERAGGTLYCAVLYFDRDGRFLGLRRKLMPTAMERLIWGFGDGSTLDVKDTAVGRVSATICWENFMPALRMTFYAQGVQFYCAPTVDDRESWLPAMRMIAMEGRCFVLSACQYLERDRLGDLAEAAQAPRGPLIRGGSVIVDPMGTVLAGPHFDQDTILYAALDRDLISQGKYDLDTTGHYARPDIFQLNVNSSQQSPVVMSSRTVTL